MSDQQQRRRLHEIGEQINTLRTEQEFILDSSFTNGHRIPQGRDLARVAQIDRLRFRLDAEWLELRDEILNQADWENLLKGGE
tara:strand:- start:452 stop:700 length:249 start_codon:yes stop_codon:yes gene_type:complete